MSIATRLLSPVMVRGAQILRRMLEVSSSSEEAEEWSSKSLAVQSSVGSWP